MRLDLTGPESKYLKHCLGAMLDDKDARDGFIADVIDDLLVDVLNTTGDLTALEIGVLRHALMEKVGKLAPESLLEDLETGLVAKVCFLEKSASRSDELVKVAQSGGIGMRLLAELKGG